jgi:hypothetical protein
MPAAARPRPLRDLVDDRRDEIRAIVRSHHGLAVAVFGSIARGDEEPAATSTSSSSSNPMVARSRSCRSASPSRRCSAFRLTSAPPTLSGRTSGRLCSLRPSGCGQDTSRSPGCPTGTTPGRGDQLAGCWTSSWHSTGQYRAQFGNSCWNTHAPDLLQQNRATPTRPVGCAYGSEGWGFESLRAR